VKTVTDQLRDALADCGETQTTIARATKVPQPVLSRFINGKRGIETDTFDTLCKYLELGLRPLRARK